LVVEAPAWSGALITANNAADQGRSVYAVPGPIDRASSLGCNKLIQNGARLVLSAEDILEDLNQLFPPSAAPAAGSGGGGGTSGSTLPAAALVDLTDEESALWQALGQEERQMDELIDATGLAASSVSVALMRLELRRLVKQLPGRRYTRLV
ncbi:MAG: DNA-processing protein DprA, partial [Verrucomicrobiaceae bacterium]